MPTNSTPEAAFVVLYRQAFRVFGTQALWNKRLLEHPTPDDALVIARALRIEGDRAARILAEQIEADIDVFHDREERVATAAAEDAQALTSAGYTVRWLRQQPAIHTAEVTYQPDGTRLEWVADSDFRFFPAVADELFGYVLHPIDLATNKVMAAAGRRELRDLVDVLTIHETILPLGAVIWAAVDKSPGFTPEGLIAEIRRNSHYPASEWRALVTAEPLDPEAILARLRAALDEAEAFVLQMPTHQCGMLFLKGGEVVQPDPARLGDYQTHRGQRRGHWPSSPEISRAMIERYGKPSD